MCFFVSPYIVPQIIFIKAPSGSANAGSVSQAASRTEEKTLVYVLVNNRARANVSSDAEANAYLAGKPEVYFVKYQGKDAQAIASAKSASQAGGNFAISAAGNAYTALQMLALRQEQAIWAVGQDLLERMLLPVPVFAACLAVASADIGLKLRQAAAAGAASSYDVGQQSVTVDYAPAVYEDTIVDGGRSFANGPGAEFADVGSRSSFSGASASAGAVSGAASGAVSGASAGASAGSAEYNAGYQAGLRAAYSGASANAGSNAQSSVGVADTRFGSSGSFSGASSGSSSFASGSSFGSSSGASSSAAAQTNVRYAAPVIQKHFYYHVAPEEPKAAAEASTLTITPRKHYKVIFIKAPSVSANAGAAAQAASRTEEKTIVYVLVNKPAQAKAGSVADASSFSSGKPEVYFVKYQGKDAQANAFADAQSFSGAGANSGSFSGANAGAFSGASADAGAFSLGGADAGFGGSFDGSAGSFAGASSSAGSSGSEYDYNLRSAVDSDDSAAGAFNSAATAGAAAGAQGVSAFNGAVAGANAGATAVNTVVY
uniref:DM5 domain-containing protein n=1 Tax=Anopheles stephensi TaxID=30069 RepID=A0A182XXU7_ANOST